MGIPRLHLIVGGQRSGKSRHAERLGLAWLQSDPGHSVCVLATAQAHDPEMVQRIARHRADRPEGFATVEVPVALGEQIRALAQPGRLLLVDCLTLWLTQVLMPPDGASGGEGPSDAQWGVIKADFLDALEHARRVQSAVVLVSNEVGWGVIPLGAGVRHFVDELGRLNQDVARRCDELTLMVAGQAWSRPVEESP
jgi:adenosylcobinamide kinase/adenosylcobinamide-phosphate guanylyltransferase